MENQVQLKFDKIAFKYDTKYKRPTSILGYEKVRRMELLVDYAQALGPEHTLDAGCGSGLALSTLKQRLPEAKLVGADLSYFMLKQAYHNGSATTPFMQSMVEQLPFADNAFDLIYALGVVDYLKQPGRFFETTRRLLKPGGHFIFTYPNGNSISRTLKTTIRRYIGTRLAVSATPLKSAAVDRLIVDNGFELVERHFITYGNGVAALPWSISMSQKMETWCGQKPLGRHLAWSGLCVARKVRQ